MSETSKNGMFYQMNQRCLYANEQSLSGSINAATVSPDGTLGASGGKDGVVRLWDTSDGRRLYSLDAGDIVHALCFSHTQFWLCAATQKCIKIWDLETKAIQDELPLTLESKRSARPHCNGLSWSRDGRTLYACYNDGVIRVWKLV